jgi:hypothetical protein
MRAAALFRLAGMTRDAIAGGCERDTQRGPTSPVVALETAPNRGALMYVKLYPNGL